MNLKTLSFTNLDDEFTKSKKSSFKILDSDLGNWELLNFDFNAFSKINWKDSNIVGLRTSVVAWFSEKKFERELKNLPEWNGVIEHGFLSRAGVAELLGRSKAGVVTFYGVPNHVDAQPNKMFEYMSAKIPVISSNFPMWKEIVEGHRCGLCVDPKDPKAIAEAINFIIENDEEAQVMAENGFNAVRNIFNWQIEEKKLLNLYARLLKK